MAVPGDMGILGLSGTTAKREIQYSRLAGLVNYV